MAFALPINAPTIPGLPGLPPGAGLGLPVALPPPLGIPILTTLILGGPLARPTADATLDGIPPELLNPPSQTPPITVSQGEQFKGGQLPIPYTIRFTGHQSNNRLGQYTITFSINRSAQGPITAAGRFVDQDSYQQPYNIRIDGPISYLSGTGPATLKEGQPGGYGFYFVDANGRQNLGLGSSGAAEAGQTLTLLSIEIFDGRELDESPGPPELIEVQPPAVQEPLPVNRSPTRPPATKPQPRYPGGWKPKPDVRPTPRARPVTGADVLIGVGNDPTDTNQDPPFLPAPPPVILLGSVLKPRATIEM